MIDIVELMRRGRVCDDKCRVMEAKSGCLCAEAADEIERLRAALERIRDVKPSWGAESEEMYEIARAALEEGL